MALPSVPELDGLRQKTEKLLRQEIQKVTRSEVVIHQDHQMVRGVQESRGGDEALRQSWEDYYHLRFAEAEERLQGHDGAEALKLKALLAYSREDRDGAMEILEKLLTILPEASLSEKDFPPGIRKIFSEIRKAHSKASWEAVLYYGIEQVGWNYQLTGRLVFPGDPTWTREKIVEMVSRKDLSKAVKILVRDLFQIDSHRAIK